MFEFDVTREKIQELLPSLDAIAKLYVGTNSKDQPDPEPQWVIIVKNGDYTDVIDVELRIVTGKGIHSVRHDFGVIATYPSVFMPHDSKHQYTETFLERLKELANNLEFRHRALLQAKAMFK